MAVKQPKGKIVRRLGVNIFGNQKYDRLLDRKPNGPGKERGGRRRSKPSVYAEQLKEKQKFRFAYGISERQFRNVYKKAQRMVGVTGENILLLLESRLDNTIYRMGFAISRTQARQMASHGYFYLNGRPVNVPSMRVKANDVITTKEKKGIQNLIRHNLSAATGSRGAWLSVNEESLSATVSVLPVAGDVQPVGNIQHVVEFYSR